MEFSRYESDSANVNVSRFRGPDGVDEYHLAIQPEDAGGIEAQLACLARAYEQALASLELSAGTAVVRRFFCSDVHNQAAALQGGAISRRGGSADSCAISWVGQAPAAPAKVALWAYHVRDAQSDLRKQHTADTLTLVRGPLSHLWTTGVTAGREETPAGEGARNDSRTSDLRTVGVAREDSRTGMSDVSDGILKPGLRADAYDQTRAVFGTYHALLGERGLRLADHLMRTWVYVANIDADYGGMVAARREFFAEHGLTPQTHFIASSGIQGAAPQPTARVSLDAYAISCLDPRQVRYLTAPDHLSPTHIYGVTFERGTAIDYRDRRHVWISGTASIDRNGSIVHAGDVYRQLDRTLENIEALLSAAAASLADMSHFIVYVRDPGDHVVVARRMRDRLGKVPMVVVTAPVCRPGWLVEVEGMAVVPADNPGLPAF